MKRISAFFIALFMIMAQFPMVATAETNNIEDGSVAYFEPLTSEVEKQTVNTKTQLSDLSLPDTLSASIYHVTNTLDKGEVITTSDVDIPVTWNSEPAYDETKAGTYVFSASIEGYVLSENAQLPVITVVTTSSLNQSINEPLTKTIADWSFVATDYSDYSENELVMAGVSMENQASFDAVVSMLPTQLSVHIENESNTSTVDITGWECVEYKQDVQNNWPDSGEYIFTAKLQEGFECEPLPSIRVIIGGITTYANNTIEEAGLKVTASNGGEVVYTVGSGFLLKSNGNYEISGTWTGELGSKGNVITVPKNVTANVTLNGVDIDVSKSDISAFAIEANGKANITLSGDNFLKSGNYRAGLEVPATAEVKISGDGSLEAICKGYHGAGIGGSDRGNSGTIVISGGNITATGGFFAAGIGSGWRGNGGIIEITGGHVKAMGGDHGAGIGGGGSAGFISITIKGDAVVEAIGGGSKMALPAPDFKIQIGTIKISGNANVKAIGKSGSGIGNGGSGSINYASGIGGGYAKNDAPNSTYIEITGGTVDASSEKGAGIGGGYTGSGGEIIISGSNTVVTAESTEGHDVGNGDGYKDNGEVGTACHLTVKDGATLEMTTNGTNVDKINLEYKSCTIIDKSVQTHYNENSEISVETPKFINQTQNQTTLIGNPVTLTVNASVSDGGTLSYQWYSNTKNNITEGIPIGNNDTYYVPPVDILGTTYYYVVITNTKSGQSNLKPASVISNVVSITVTAPSTSSSSGGTSIKNTYSTKKDAINQTISNSNLKSMIRNKKTLTLNSNKVSMSFEPDALKSILDVIPSSARKITFKAVPADLSAYPNASAMVGNHPVYDFSISYKDSRGREYFVDVNFPAGSVGITLNYTPTANETAGNLFMVAIDDKGNVTWLDYSSYGKGQVIAEALHFSLYGIAYKTETPTYTDIKDHWAKSDIEFVVARGLLGGNDNLFTPESLLTRGMFIEALEQLAGIDAQPTHRLNEALTREQAALILADYAEQLEITMSETLSAIKYADQSKISTMARKAVKLMQRAGIIRGKDGNQFDPQGKVTKAEGAAILHRFIEAVIDPSVMNGWLKNDSGHWQYYQKGKAVTGWQTIDKLRHYFNDDGEMYEGWKYDKKKWYYWNNDGAVIGWKFINGKWYYFESDGVMASNTWIKGYQLGEDGAWIK